MHNETHATLSAALDEQRGAARDLHEAQCAMRAARATVTVIVIDAIVRGELPADACTVNLPLVNRIMHGPLD